MIRLLAAATMLVVLGGGAYLAGGFVRFTEEVATLPTPAGAESIDGIVVLTGGSQRIEQAMDLLRQGNGRRLLISGVNPDTGVRSLSRLTGGDDEQLFACCVDLDYDALNTIGNARMAVDWARRNGLERLYLVTSDYHIPRSMIEIASIDGAPDFVPYPVHPDKLWQANGAPSRLGLRLLVSEYAKVLLARTRIALGIEPEPFADRQVASHEAGD